MQAPSRTVTIAPRLSRREYQSQAAAMKTARSEVAKTGPATLPTYRVTCSIGAEAPPKDGFCQSAMGSEAARRTGNDQHLRGRQPEEQQPRDNRRDERDAQDHAARQRVGLEKDTIKPAGFPQHTRILGRDAWILAAGALWRPPGVA